MLVELIDFRCCLDRVTSVTFHYQLAMEAKKVFTYISNILGLNFVDVPAPYAYIVIFQVCAAFQGFFMTFYWKFSMFDELPKDIYFFIDTFQLEVLYVLHLTFVVRALVKRKLQKKISDTIRFSLNANNDASEMKMSFGILYLVLSRVLKLAVSVTVPMLIYMTKAMFSELIFATSDLMFVFYISKLTAHLKLLKLKLLRKNLTKTFENEERELLMNFQVKRDIQQRYSLELLLSVFYNFIHLIISLYYIFMRVRFNLLNSVSRKNIFSFLLSFLSNLSLIYRLHDFHLPDAASFLTHHCVLFLREISLRGIDRKRFDLKVFNSGSSIHN